VHRPGLSTRIAGALGLAFVVLSVAPLAIAPPPPPAGTAASDVVHYYTVNRDGLLFAAWLGAVGIAPSFVFLARVVAIVRDAEGDRPWLWLVSVFGLVGAFAAVIALTALGVVLPYSAASLGPDVARAVSDLLQVTFAVYFFPIVAFFVGVGLVTTARGGLPRWLGPFACVVAGASAIATLGIFVDWEPLRPGGTYSLGAFTLQLAWWSAAGLVLLLRPTRAPRNQTKHDR
jgi:hypothetical protein